MKRNPRKLFVLAYHEVEDLTNFQKQIRFLKNNYNILDNNGIKLFFDENYDIQYQNNLIITFDDGDISNFTKAFPVLKEHNIPAIFFVITDLINSKKPFWWDEIQHILGKQVGYKKVWEVKKIPNQERMDFLSELKNNNKFSSLEHTQLTTSQLKEMKEAGMVIGNHSHTHPMFNQCTSEEINKELEISGSFLEKVGFNPEYFAYPNGNYSGEAEEQLKKSGIKYAFLFDHKINKGDINPLRISRLIVDDTTPLWKFKLILSGWHGKILPLTRLAGKLRK